MDDKSLREQLRSNLDNWVTKLRCNDDVTEKLRFKMKFVEELKNMPIAINTNDANKQHYEVPTEFFKIVLGNRLKYSSCLYPDGTCNINYAEDAMLQLVCERARVKDGMSVMDLGCGWGATSFWICEQYPNCTVTAISNSKTQAMFINELASRKRLSSRLKCVTADANTFTTNEKFDRIISIEMFEHMKNYKYLLQKLSTWLKPNGYLFTQILCHKDACYHFKQDKNEWMAKYFFSGGTMPSSDLFLYFQDDLKIVGHWNINGKHYSKTLEAWLEKLDKNKERVLSIFRKSYDNPQEQLSNWRMFFIYCSEVFNFSDGNEYIVTHHLFERQSKSKL